MLFLIITFFFTGKYEVNYSGVLNKNPRIFVKNASAQYHHKNSIKLQLSKL